MGGAHLDRASGSAQPSRRWPLAFTAHTGTGVARPACPADTQRVPIDSRQLKAESGRTPLAIDQRLLFGSLVAAETQGRRVAFWLSIE